MHILNTHYHERMGYTIRSFLYILYGRILSTRYSLSTRYMTGKMLQLNKLRDHWTIQNQQDIYDT